MDGGDEYVLGFGAGAGAITEGDGSGAIFGSGVGAGTGAGAGPAHDAAMTTISAAMLVPNKTFFVMDFSLPAIAMPDIFYLKL